MSPRSASEPGLDDGIWVLDAATPIIEKNIIREKAGDVIRVGGDGRPTIGKNDLRSREGVLTDRLKELGD